MTGVQNDPDRVLHPLRRRPDGSFERVSWELALDDIGTRLRSLIAARGGSTVGWYLGNPSAFSYSHPIWVKGFMDAIGSPNLYSAGSQDVNNRFVASQLLYGSPLVVPIPDLDRTEFLLIVGANPLVSHGSVLTAPRIKDSLHDIVTRGGRVLVVDPRRSETAREFEHVADQAGRRRVAAALAAERHLRGGTRGPGGARTAGQRAGHAPATRRRASSRGDGGPHGRSGRGRAPAGDRSGWGRRRRGVRANRLVSRAPWNAGLIPARCVERGHRKPGPRGRGASSVLGRSSSRTCCTGSEPTATASSTHVSEASPTSSGQLPASVMAKEITTPGAGQIRALFVSSGNPVLSVPERR